MLKAKLNQLLEVPPSKRRERLRKLVADEVRLLRVLLGNAYHADAEKRDLAAEGLALAAEYHPELVGRMIRRLVWAMNDESGTNGLYAPPVLERIAERRPELLIPVVPDLLRLSRDPGLQAGLTQVLEEVRASCPGEIGEELGRDLSRRGRGK